MATLLISLWLLSGVDESGKLLKELKLIGLAYANHQDVFQRGPQKVEELAPFLEIDDHGESAYKKLVDGTVLLYTSPKSQLTASQSARTCLGYTKEVPTKGGWVVLVNGAIKEVTAQEFAAMRKMSENLVSIGKNAAKAFSPRPPSKARKKADPKSAAGKAGQEIGLLYHHYLGEHDLKAPAKLADLKPILDKHPELKTGHDALETGKFVLVYGVSILEMREGASNTCIAYEKEALTKGGVCVMGDGDVVELTAAELASSKPASKADKKKSTSKKRGG